MEKIDYLKEFMAKLQSLDRSRSLTIVFKDFLTVCTCSLAQTIYRSDELEQKYLQTIKQYTKEQAEEFSKLLAFLVRALEEKYQDFLGEVFMRLNLGNSAIGQFETPYTVSKFMAEINFSELKVSQKIENNHLITLSESCCGSGGMIIAFAETLKEHNFNYQKYLYVEAIDIDEMSFMMAYIQLTLLGIPAKVIQGNTLTLKFQHVLYTPFYFVNCLQWKLKRQVEEVNPNNIQLAIQTEHIQLNLF